MTAVKAPRRFHRTRRHLRLAVELLFAAAFMLSLLMGLLIWKLDQGEVTLASILPDIENVLSDIAPGLQFDIKRALIEGGGNQDVFALRIHEVTIRNNKQTVIATIDNMLLGFSWRNLAHLTLIPARIDIVSPAVKLTRFKDGHVGFNARHDQDAAQDEGGLPEIAHLLSHAPGVLGEIQIHKALAIFTDEQDAQLLRLENGTFLFQRDGKKVNGILAMDLHGAHLDQPLRGTIDYNPEQNVTEFSTVADGLVLEQIASFVPQIPTDLKMTMPFNVALAVAVDEGFKPVSADLRLVAKQGELTYPPYYLTPVALNDIAGVLHYDFKKNLFDLKSLDASLDKAHLTAHARMYELAQKDKAVPPDHPVEFAAELRDFPVDKLPAYWPQGVGQNTRDWVVPHITQGTAQLATLHGKAHVSPEGHVAMDDMRGEIDFTDSHLNYLPPMQPADHLNGKATYDPDHFDVTLTQGDVFNTKLKQGVVHIIGLREPHQQIAIAIDTDGPIADAMHLIASKPLEYLQKLEMNPDQFSGQANAHLELAFPLLKALKLTQVQMQVKADLHDVTVKKVVKDLDIAAEKLDFAADTNAMDVKGTVRLADAANALEWQEYFGTEAENNTVITTKGAVTPALLKGLHLNADDYFKGSAANTTTLKRDHNKTTHLTVNADLANAAVSFADLNIQKKVGATGHLNLTLAAEKEGPTTISNLDLTLPQLTVNNATLRFNKDMALDGAILKDVRSGRSRASVTVTPAGKDTTRLVMTGDTIDLSGYWAAKKASAQKPSMQRYDLSLRAKRLFLDPEIALQNVTANLVVVGRDLRHGQINAQVDDASLTLNQIERNDGSRQLAINMIDAGKVLRALDMTDTVRGGTLSLTGQSTAKDPSIISGSMTMDKFVVVRAPVLARLINAFSPGGLIDLLNSNGLSFNSMKSDFVLEDPNTIHLKSGKMKGASIGLNFGGRIHRDTQTVDLSGTIIPIQGLNKFISFVPLIGQILTGLKSEGIFGATYTITGPSENPSVSVNPLSVLTPGILRSILFEDNSN